MTLPLRSTTNSVSIHDYAQFLHNGKTTNIMHLISGLPLPVLEDEPQEAFLAVLQVD